MSRKPREKALSSTSRGSSASSPAKRTPIIIVPLDGSIHSLAALPIAKAMAKLEKATLHILHVAEPVLPPSEALHKLGLTPEQLRGSIIDEVAGTPATAIVRIAKQWQSLSIVMCTHTGMLEPHGELGPVAEEVMRLAPCPLVLVRPERGLQHWELHRILLPHDGTPSTAVAIGPAADLARKAGAELAVLHVATPGAGRLPEPGTFVGPRYLDQPQHEWPAWTREFLDRLCALGHAPTEVKTRLFLAKGEPGTQIVQFATNNDADIIVLGWHGRLEPERAITMKKVIGNAPCPVLVVRVESQPTTSVGRGRSNKPK